MPTGDPMCPCGCGAFYPMCFRPRVPQHPFAPAVDADALRQRIADLERELQAERFARAHEKVDLETMIQNEHKLYVDAWAKAEAAEGRARKAEQVLSEAMQVVDACLVVGKAQSYAERYRLECARDQFVAAYRAAHPPAPAADRTGEAGRECPECLGLRYVHVSGTASLYRECLSCLGTGRAGAKP